MSPVAEIQAPPLPEEHPLAELKNVQLDKVGKGKLLLTSKSLLFERKNNFFSSPHLEFSIRLADITSAKVRDSSTTLVLEWAGSRGERAASRLSLAKGEAAVAFCRDLKASLETLRQQNLLRERKAQYRLFLDRTACVTWLVVDLLVGIFRDLTYEGWDGIDASTSQAGEMATALAELQSVDIVNQLKAVNDAVLARDASSVLRKVVSTLQVIGETLGNDAPEPREFTGIVAESPHLTSWFDIRYIFLFAFRYRLLCAWLELGENLKADECLPQLSRLAAVLIQRLSLHPGIDSPSSDDKPAITAHVQETARTLEAYLHSNVGS
ncbi:MAG: hypothetical protein IBX68_00055 [Dehalococcoidia bacterium]|nr:hypothetical protein [Dehalococcoidia bacterium]